MAHIDDYAYGPAIENAPLVMVTATHPGPPCGCGGGLTRGGGFLARSTMPPIVVAHS
jgi:hypothetical protein